MKFSKKFSLLTFVCLITIFSFSQTNVNNYDPKAKAILDEVSKTMRKDSSKTATFTITMKKADGTFEKKKGSLIMKSQKYKITLENKIKDKIKREEYYNNGKIAAVYSEKDNEVTFDSVPKPSAKNPGSISPCDMFTIFEKGFKYTFIKEDSLNGKAVQYIDLFPENPEKKNYHTVHLIIDKAKKQIISVEFINKDGSTTTYTIDTFTPNLPVPDNTFEFDPKTHPGVSTH